MNSFSMIAKSYAQKIWNDKDLTAIDHYLHSEVTIHSLLGSFQGRKAMREIVLTWLNGFPDLFIRNKDVICENDKVVLVWSAEGTHKGDFKGKSATGKKILYEGVTIYHLQEKTIKEYWAFLNMHQLLSQIS